LLPLSTNRCALVWTLAPEGGAQLAQCPEHQFLTSLQDTFGDRLGRFIALGTRQAYPLRLTRISEQFRPGVLVLGNAAHSLHPVAGQGFNLALRGVAAWLSFLQERRVSASGLGQAELLDRFCVSLAADQQRTIAFSDRLVRTFGSASPILGLARDLGLIGLEALPGAKVRFARLAMGMAAHKPAFGRSHD
jgi:2-octaprenyl-6-methoxyphenol hydroxylase